MSSRISSSLKNTFGEIPLEVYNQVKYFTYNERKKKFTCKLCKKVILKKAPKILEAHLKSEYHRRASCTVKKVNQALNKSFRNKIPQVVQNNISVLDTVKDGYKCVICDIKIKESKDPKVSSHNLSYHLKSVGHEEMLEDFDTTLEQLKDIYGDIPQVVENNKKFIDLDRSRKNYECKICKVLLKVNKNNMEKTEETFEKHFYSPQHVWEAKCSKFKSLIPEFQQSGQRVHTFLTRNIDYLSTNGAGFFCSLCHDNISRNINDVNETIENLKHHVLSSDHEENLFGRLNHENEVLDNLVKVFGDLTDETLKNLRYLERKGNYFNCNICRVEIFTDLDWDGSNDKMCMHFESDFHKDNLSEEHQRCTTLTEELEGICGKVPEIIEENLQFIEYVGGNNFQCTLCDSTLSVQQGNRNLESHLKSNEHVNAKEREEFVSESVDDELEMILGEDYEEKLPECIKNNNWSIIDFKRNSGNFRCSLCNDTILVDKGNKQEEMTMQNFKSHLYSARHTALLKKEARKAMETSQRLELFFGGVPKSILNNVQFLFENGNESFTCDLCNVEIQISYYPEITKQKFLQHFRESVHINNVERIATNIDNAFRFLDKKLGVPDLLLRDIDFWDNSSDDPNIYCTLCQEDLDVDLKNLKQTRNYLEDHVNSERHKENRECF